MKVTVLRDPYFPHVTAEEIGHKGGCPSPMKIQFAPLWNTIADLNVDMMGRIDPKEKRL
jgi:hypothetical protein